MVRFIAEVSSNHHRDLDRCLEFIDKAVEVGCHAVKFQLFKIDQLFSPEILERSENHRHRRKWELPLDFLPHLSRRCKEMGIEFGCTPFYLDAVDELLPYVDFYKVASYELLWDELLKQCAQTGRPVILSTGMATMNEVGHAVEVVRASGCDDLTLLHCISGYPTPVDECNLAAIKTLRQNYRCETGWSDHSVSPAVIYRAVHAWGARMIEFHLDLDKEGAEYAGGHCWLPGEIGGVITTVVSGLQADGNGIKAPVAAEIDDREWRADPEDGLRPMKKIRATWKAVSAD